MKLIKALFFVIVLALVVGAAFIASGTYDIGADAPHWAVTARAIDLLRDRSITTHAHGIAVPNLEDPKRLAEGAEHYAGMCTGCHLAPGAKNSELRAGLYPTPPNLTERRALDPAEAFWVIKHGVKLTAMPAWGKSHADDKIWSLVAFVKKLPDLTPEQYQQMTGDAGAPTHHHDHDHADGEDHAVHEHDGATDRTDATH
jgi:mono/diheme cytochrome c family protein